MMCGCFVFLTDYTEVVVSCENSNSVIRQTSLKVRSYFLRYSALQLMLCVNYSKVVVSCEDENL